MAKKSVIEGILSGDMSTEGSVNNIAQADGKFFWIDGDTVYVCDDDDPANSRTVSKDLDTVIDKFSIDDSNLCINIEIL